MAFKFIAIDPSSGCERWVDPLTGDVQLRNCPTPEQIKLEVSQSTPRPDPTKETLSQAQLDRIVAANDINPTAAASPVYKASEGEQNSNSNSGVSAPTNPGVGSANDDNTNRPTPGQTINQNANGPVKAQPNVLDQYASYTYSLSWYVMTPDQFNSLKDGQININKWMLLMQSGGAQANVNDNGQGGRSPYFTLDYYMDNLELTTNMPGAGPGATLGANNGGEIKFTVTEPNGITLPNNLALAYQDAIKNATGIGEKDAYTQGIYCMVIKFYGYDDEGNLIQAGRAGNQNGTASAASPRAVVQKIYPFSIDKFDFRVANKIIEYTISGSVVAYTVCGSTRRGSIPAPFELVGKTVKDILAGNKSTGTTVTKVDDSLRKTTPTVTTAPGNQTPQSTTVTGEANQDVGGGTTFSLGIGA